eukprot:Sspe_Gene.8071::Locus_2750_Transcript_1_1_Confidence_1.000_Length_1021::g.8071::m.8071
MAMYSPLRERYTSTSTPCTRTLSFDPFAMTGIFTGSFGAPSPLAGGLAPRMTYGKHTWQNLFWRYVTEATPPHSAHSLIVLEVSHTVHRTHLCQQVVFVRIGGHSTLTPRPRKPEVSTRTYTTQHSSESGPLVHALKHRQRRRGGRVARRGKLRPLGPAPCLRLVGSVNGFQLLFEILQVPLLSHRVTGHLGIPCRLGRGEPEAVV